MSAYGVPARPGSVDGCTDDRWARVWSHRDHLLRVARRRSVSMEDAEDVVQEAMVRAAERTNVDHDRLGAWLTSVTMRLCVDRFRQINREANAHLRSVLATPGKDTAEEVVCDRSEAEWLAARSSELPERQEQVLSLMAQGFDLTQIAHETGLSYQAVRSLLARARKTLRAALTGTLAIVCWAFRGRPRAAGGTVQATTVVSAAVTVAIAGLGLAGPLEAEAEEAPAPRVHSYEMPRSAGSGGASKGEGASSSEQPPSVDPSDRGNASAFPVHEGRAAAPGAGAVQEPFDGQPVPSSVPQASGLPALPGLPERPDPALPVVPDVMAVDPLVSIPALPAPAASAPLPVPVDSPADMPGGPAAVDAQPAQE